MHELQTNFSALSSEAQHFLFSTICKLDVACEDISKLVGKPFEDVRKATVSLIACTLEKDNRTQIGQLHMLAGTAGLNQYAFDMLNNITRQSTLTLINSAAYAISELWSLSNAGISLEIIGQIVNQESKYLMSKSTPEEIAAYFKSMDYDENFLDDDNVEIEILILPHAI